ncbi:MAG TPA: hypothetical protein VH589_11100 [Trebonia sp.]|jgi:hypothetical protein
MTGLTTWQTDDPCPACGALLTEISGPSSDRVIQQCRACAWSVTWAAPQPVLVLTGAQSDCLAAMAADAIAYRRAAATGCPHCRQALAGDCPEHSPDSALIESYRQLAADLASAGGGR